MNYFATYDADSFRVLTIDSTIEASIDSMSALAQFGNVRRIACGSKAYAAYSNGRELKVDIDVVDGKVVRKIKNA